MLRGHPTVVPRIWRATNPTRIAQMIATMAMSRVTSTGSA